ncbi:MAG: RHS domain-containing protein [Candidatus Thiodiazotropha sp. (ex Ctena orbiculata)]|nr:RHS domain-containing protein [Candidatus Thiodiazotropha taylori]
MRRIRITHGFVVSLLLALCIQVAYADVELPKGKYYQDIDDMTTQVLGGEVTIRRTWYEGQWFSNRAWEPLGILGPVDTQNPNEKLFVSAINRNEDRYEPNTDANGDCYGNCGSTGGGGSCASPPISEVLACLATFYEAMNSAGVYYTLNNERSPFVPEYVHRISRTSTGFQWTNKDDDWINYDFQGNIQAYGNKAGTTATFTHDASGRRSSVRDRLGNTIYTYEYDAQDNLRFVRTTDGRQVEYRYTGDLLTEVIDVRGKSWRYTYDNTNPDKPPKLTTITDPVNRVTTIDYTRTGRVASELLVDPDNNRRLTSYVYDYDRNRKQFYVQITGPRGEVTEQFYDTDNVLARKIVNNQEVFSRERDSANGNIIHNIRDRRRQLSVREFDDWNNLIKTTHPDGTVTTATYEPRTTRVNERVDELGRITRYEYYDNGLLLRKTEAADTPQERITEYEYNVNNQLSRIRRLGDADTQEAITSFAYNTRGLLETVTGQEGGLTRYDYNPSGDVTTLTDANTHAWIYNYDAAGNLLSVTDQLQREVSHTYDDVGNRQTSTTPRQHTTTYQYNLLDKPISETDPLTHRSRFGYDINGNLTTVIDPLVNTQRLEYDLENRLISHQDAAGNLTQLGYGERSGQGGGNTGSVNYPGLLNRIEFPTYLQTYDYDRRNRRTRVIDHLDTGTAITTTEYDEVGNVISTTDAEDRVTQYRYDALDRLIEVIDPLNQSTRFSYDNRDNLLSVTDPNTHTTRYTYDRADRKTSEIRPGGQTIYYQYDPAGNLTTTTDPDGRRTVNTYDEADQLETQAHYAPGATNPERTVTYSYDPNGNLTGWSDGAISATLVYDVNNRKTSEAVNYGSFSLTHSYTYDAAGNKHTYTGPDNITITYHRVNDQLNRIELPNEGSITYNSYRWNQPTRITYPGGSNRQTEYDNLLRPTRILTEDPGQNPLLDYQYNYDATGNILQKATQAKTVDYDYDLLQRLTEAAATIQPDIGDPQVEIEGWQYDPNGNRTQDNLNPGSWVYDLNDRLQSSPIATYGYDQAGNTISKTVGGIVTHYRYNAEGRLARIEDANQVLIAEYLYDPLGRRIRKQTQSEIICFHYADEGLAGEFDGTGNQIRLYGYQPDSIWTTDPIYQKTAQGYAYYQNDHLGMPQQLIQKNGAKAWEGNYRAFGELTTESGTRENRLRFPGQYFDEETGNYYNYFRTYDPSAGRYLESDPIGLAGSINTYTYVDSDPVNWADFLGLCPGCSWVQRGYSAWRAWDALPSSPSSRPIPPPPLTPPGWPEGVPWPDAEVPSPYWDEEGDDEKCPPEDDYPTDPDDWPVPDDWEETPAGEKTGGKHRQWKGPDGKWRRWDKEGRKGGKERGPHWHDWRRPGDHIDPTR